MFKACIDQLDISTIIFQPPNEKQNASLSRKLQTQKDLLGGTNKLTTGMSQANLNARI